MKLRKQLLALCAATAAVAALALPATSVAATVTPTDPQAGGIGYAFTVTLGRHDTATFSSHVGAWSWEDDRLFNTANGDAPVGWTHTSNWVAVEVTVPVVFTVRLERDANVPWPSTADPNRLASVASMYPSFTIWKGWDNDLAPQAFADEFNGGTPTDDWHTYNNRAGGVAWAEDIGYLDHLDNSVLETVERTCVLQPGKYTIVIGSNSTANDTDRQGYKATFSTVPELTADAYFTRDAIRPLSVPATGGVLANDLGATVPADVIELVSGPARGQLALGANGSFTYTPGAYFGVAGHDSFSYRLLVGGDSNVPTAAKTVSISTLRDASGCYAGHLKNDLSGAVSGLLKLDLTRTGTWTAALTSEGRKYSLSGRLSPEGRLTPTRTPADFNLVLNLLTDENGARHVALNLRNGNEDFTATASQSPFSAENPPPFLGLHTVALTVDPAGTSLHAAQTPGLASLRIYSNGTASLTGRLGDRTVFASVSALIEKGSSGPVLPVFAAIYRRPVGSVSGELQFGAAATSNATGRLKVEKPDQTSPVSPGYVINYNAASTPR